MAGTAINPLPWFEVPRPLVEPVVSALRLGNTALDALFYDVSVLATELFWRGSLVEVDYEAPPAARSGTTGGFHVVGLGALSNPEGSILVVDAARPPYVRRRFDDVRDFLHAAKSAEPPIRALSVTGVGSSALGSVAFAWNISTALGEPVAAIVPGYGVADAVEQAFGGWFGFGLHGWLVKQTAQGLLARMAPGIARIGRALMMTAPGHGEAENGAPVFERGSGSSDVLHAILKRVPGIDRLFGHSKGALVIENAILDLGDATTERLHIVTFGCPIAESTPAAYRQILGWFDWLGLLNSWGNAPDLLIPAHHTTNTWLPLSTPVALFAHSVARKRTMKQVLDGSAPAGDAIRHHRQ